MGRFIKREGQRFGRLLVIKRAGSNKQKTATWECLCDCGKMVVMAANNLQSGNSRSCGCLQRELTSARSKRHGLTKTTCYNAWFNMKQRCTNAKGDDVKNYQNRGIMYCKEWEHFLNFYRDVGDKPANTYLDRIDNEKGYSKENCKWSTPAESALNKRSSKTWHILGQQFPTSKDAAIALGVSEAVIHRRCKGKVIRGKYHPPYEGHYCVLKYR